MHPFSSKLSLSLLHVPVGSTVFWRSSSGDSWPLEFGAGSCELLPYPAAQEHCHAMQENR